MKKAEFQLESLTCPSCVKKIEAMLSKTEGVASAKVLFNSSKVKTEFDESQISADKLEEKIVGLGYPVLTSKIS